MANLTKKRIKEWTEEYESVFQELKMVLTLVMILTIPNLDEIYVVYIDAFIVGLGCILMHNGKVVAY